jgi:serine/threonine protein kinase
MAVTTSMTVSLTRPACSEPPPIPTAAKGASPRSRLARGSDPAIKLPKELTTRARRKTRTKPDLHTGLKAGAWKIERELGKGGMASVYAVVHSRFGKRAALKVAHRSIIGPAFTSDTFLREARIVNLVNHPGVTDVFATGTYDGCPYLVMERLTGQTLGDRLEKGAMDRAAAIELLLELCDVLGAAHKAGVVHRDLKLDNVFLLETPCSGGRTVKLLDWGVAAILGEPDPMTGMIAGTLTYVAPEQVRGDDLTTAADVYSLAVLAYQMLFGQPPFAAPKDLDLIQKHLRATPPAPSSLWAEIPADLEAPDARRGHAGAALGAHHARDAGQGADPAVVVPARGPPDPPADRCARARCRRDARRPPPQDARCRARPRGRSRKSQHADLRRARVSA